MIFKQGKKYRHVMDGGVWTYAGADYEGLHFKHPTNTLFDMSYPTPERAAEAFEDENIWAVCQTSTQPAKRDLKYDQDKPRMALLTGGFPNALEEVGKVLTFGAQKYEANSWQTVDNGRERYESALMRHLLAPHKGENTDPESGLLHLTHAAFNALAILEIELRKQKQQ